MNHPTKTRKRWTAYMALTIVVTFLIAASLPPALAQSGGSKDTKKLRGKVDSARKSIEGAEKEIQATMATYNSIVEQTTKNPAGQYKKLSKAVESCDKAATNAEKAVQSMNKDLEKFFAAWEVELADYSTGSLAEASRKNFDEVKAKFDRFNASLGEASELYDPFIASLREQVLYMGRDLSPTAIEALKDPAAELNDMANQLYEKIDEVLNDTREQEAEEAAEVEAAEEAEGAEESEESKESDEEQKTEGGY
jgi:hypothetical protein